MPDVAAFIVQPVAQAIPLLRDAPLLSAAHAAPLYEIQSVDQQGKSRSLFLPSERALTVRIDGRALVTLMTLGASPELLVLGYLRNQRVVDNVAQIASLRVDWQQGVADVALRPGLKAATPAGSSGCGLGTAFLEIMRADGTLSLPPVRAARITANTVLSVLETMRQFDAIHRAAGSVHGCALFDGVEMWVSVEDVSRHNGVDAVTGWMALHGVTGEGKLLFTTGRLTGEMVMKAAYNGIPAMVSRNGVTAKGYEVAAKLGLTLFGRAANRRFICYAGAEHFDAEM